jgi:aspartyl protease family protein
MYVKQVLPLFICAVALGWFMPSAPDEAASATEPKKPVQVVTTDTATGFDSGDDDDIEQLTPEQIVLDRQSDGHFYADVDVNFGSVRFLVDTGATTVALTGDDARELGLNWSADELLPIARGASGDVMGKEVTIDRMQIGNVQATNVRAAIIPEGLDVSLLGQTFLARIGSVNIRKDKMVWN